MFGAIIAYEGAVAVTADDANADPHGPFAGLYVGATGDVVVQTLRNQTATFKAVPVGTILPIACTRVWSTGTVGNGALILGLTQLPYKGK